MTEGVLVLAAVLAVAFGLRSAFVRHGAASQVDQYYWLLAARSWRKARRPPVRLPGKYLLEDEMQAYPPAFGFLLGRLPAGTLEKSNLLLPILPDALTAAALAGLLAYLGSGSIAVSGAIAAVAFAPVLITYNAQINPRALGQLFLTALVVFEVLASEAAFGNSVTALLWAGALASAALVVLSHKMSTQLMLVLWPVMALALGSATAAVIPPLGVVLAALITGPRFAAYQWRAHWDIVAFWNRHHASIGAHAFHHSPLYGDPARLRETAYHAGWPGARRHLATIAGYAPLNLTLPFVLFWAAPPPDWLLVWFAAPYVVAGLTLFIGPLKCLGGGHLYIYNAVAPGAVWWGLALTAGGTAEWVLFAAGLGLTALSLGIAWRRVGARPNALDEGFEKLLGGLRGIRAGKVAVFPLTASEAVACRTGHAVLWGGHGFGFRRLEGLFPIVTRPLHSLLTENKIEWLAWSTRYWPQGAEVVRKENICAEPPTEFGDWRLVGVTPPSP
ncbi:MAG: hypothetical protein IIB66_04775 [Proteobacteria bacterium]|nr:hypothetical protein [Pseudomonadota bacterium]